MASLASGRTDPRALLRASRMTQDRTAAGRIGAGFGRTVVIAMASVMSLGAFGTFVVRANDDAGALAFIRSQVKQRPAAAAYAPAAHAPPRAAYPVSYFAPRIFAPAAPAVRGSAAVQAQRNGAITASYAPFAGFFPSDANPGGLRDPLRPRSVSAPVRRKAESPAAASQGGPVRGGIVTYCVRTCDGFFFPLGAGTGSVKGDEAACSKLCPTTETRVFTGQIGAEIEDARSRDTGRRYASFPNALAYRTSFSSACSCSDSGFGLSNTNMVVNDRTLKVGDIVMTGKGMRVFIGGQMPYRDANFTSIDGSRSFAGQSRETLRRMERASLPGKSGVAARQPRQDELRDLRRAAASLEAPGQLVRYVGPDRTAIAR
jgi:hypothetical protein